MRGGVRAGIEENIKHYAMNRRIYLKLGDEDVSDASQNRDEVEHIPRFTEIVLQQQEDVNVHAHIHLIEL